MTQAADRLGTGYKYSDSQISCLYYHSEFQALSQVKLDLPLYLEDLFGKMLAKATAPAEIVVNSMQVLGASEPNTVCSNGCKVALVMLADRIASDFLQQLESRKAKAQGLGFTLRISREYAARTSIKGAYQFDLYGKGAHPVDRDDTSGPSGVVTEYLPIERGDKETMDALRLARGIDKPKKPRKTPEAAEDGGGTSTRQGPARGPKSNAGQGSSRKRKHSVATAPTEPMATSRARKASDTGPSAAKRSRKAVG